MEQQHSCLTTMVWGRTVRLEVRRHLTRLSCTKMGVNGRLYVATALSPG